MNLDDFKDLQIYVNNQIRHEEKVCDIFYSLLNIDIKNILKNKEWVIWFNSFTQKNGKIQEGHFLPYLGTKADRTERYYNILHCWDSDGSSYNAQSNEAIIQTKIFFSEKETHWKIEEIENDKFLLELFFQNNFEVLDEGTLWNVINSFVKFDKKYVPSRLYTKNKKTYDLTLEECYQAWKNDKLGSGR